LYCPPVHALPYIDTTSWVSDIMDPELESLAQSILQAYERYAHPSNELMEVHLPTDDCS